MIAPSISFDTSKVKPMWRHLTLDDVKGLICDDVAEINRLLTLRAEDKVQAEVAGRQPNLTLTTLIKAWEITQDVHWSWYKEIRNARTSAPQRPQGLGKGFVGASN